MYPPYPHVAVRRLQLDAATNTLVVAPKKEPFLRGPIPLGWVTAAASLPGKTINVALALWWRHGMAQGKPFKLTQTALTALNVERDAESRGIARLEQAGLIHVERKPGQRPLISLLDLSRSTRAACDPQTRPAPAELAHGATVGAVVPPVWSANLKRQPVLIAGDGRKGPRPDARRRQHRP